ncbi:MAG: META domain-containing protein [Anaerolineae bacterium]|nr:META domain-containing protein [Anaerolineae bacterium]
MKARMMLLLVFAVVAMPVGLMPAAAQDSGANRVSYNGVSFEFDPSLAYGVIAEVVPPEPPELEGPGGPLPGHLRFTLINRQGVEGGAFDAPNVWIFTTSEFARYPFYQTEFDALRGILDERPDLTDYLAVVTDGSRNLPFLPVVPAAQVIRGQPAYIEGAGWRGVRYLTVYRQDVSPFMANDFRYTLQALTDDGRYLAVSVPLQTGLFPSELPADFDYDTFTATFEQYLSESVTTLDQAGPEAFTPSLSVVERFVGTITLEGENMASGGGATPELEGTNWNLVSLGGQNAVASAQPVTLQFLAGGNVAGNAGCNTYGGAYEASGQQLTFGQLISTLRACEPMAVMQQESDYLTALQSGGTYQIDGNRLTITSVDGASTLVFEAAQ